MKKRLFLAFATAAALIPLVAGGAPVLAQMAGHELAVRPGIAPLGFDHAAQQPFRVLEDARRPDVLEQVRIRQRVVIRISPSPPDARERMAALQPGPASRTYEEVAHGDCVEVEDIAGVQPTQDNRLLLFMRNRQVLAAALDRSCSARAFYSGFYVERSDDGRLCIARDRLQSRAGASCTVDQLTRLVAGN